MAFSAPRLSGHPLAERMAAKTGTPTAEGCWPWIGTAKGNGYGMIVHNGVRWLAHRLAYELQVGPIPSGLQIDHLCRNRGCVNPAHMEPVTNRENGLRGISPAAEHARSTACPRGHPYDASWAGRYGHRRRGCLRCHAKHQREAARRLRFLGTCPDCGGPKRPASHACRPCFYRLYAGRVSIA